MLSKLAVVCLAVLMTGPAMAKDLKVKLLDPWNGRRVPEGQQCRNFGGDGATPPMEVSRIPPGTAWIVAEFNNRSYKPLAKDGGHGQIAWPVNWPITYLYPVPGLTGLPRGGAFVVKPARTTGAYASPGYLPPCSGGNRNRYEVDIIAVDANGNVLGERRGISIGKY